MAYQLYALLIIFLVLSLAVVRRFSIYSPLVISSIVWFFVFIVGLFFNDRFYPLTDKVFIAWLIWFLVSGAFYFVSYPARKNNKILSEENKKIPFNYSVLLYFIIAWLVYKIWYLGNNGSEHFFLNLRLSSTGAEGFESIGLLEQFYPLIFSLFLFEHVHGRKDNQKLRFLLWLWMILYGIAVMGKFAILTPILSWLFIRGINKKIHRNDVVIILTFTVIIMMILHFVRSGSEDESTVYDVIALYIYSPLVALNYLDVDGGSQFGVNVFRLIYAIGRFVGFDVMPIEVILPYVSVPELTNVYTVMYPFYYDFNLFGVAFGASIYGVIFSLLYYFSYYGNKISIALFSGLSIILIGQFIGELLFSTLASHIYLIAFLLLISYFSKKVDYVR